MTVSLYASSVPVFVRGLTSLGAYLEKARANAAERKFEPAVLIAARLAPDMLPLPRQVQIACDTAKNAAARLAQADIPGFADTETSFEELQARIAKTTAFLQTITEPQLAGAEDRQITLKFPGRELTFSGADYLTSFALPNFYFHLTTAYAILRHNGAPLGKSDFLGG